MKKTIINLTKNEIVLINFGIMNCECFPSNIMKRTSLHSECGSFCCVSKLSKSYSFNIELHEYNAYYKITETCDDFRKFMLAIGFAE